ERVLEINPGNAAAAASLESLRMLETAVQSAPAPADDPAPVDLRDESHLAVEVGKFAENIPDEKHPTQDLELPDGVMEAFGSPEPAADLDITENAPDSMSAPSDLPFVDEAEPEASNSWEGEIVPEILSPE